eukprot:6180272-Pleurochrysis_carterae.AAC.2
MARTPVFGSHQRFNFIPLPESADVFPKMSNRSHHHRSSLLLSLPVLTLSSLVPPSALLSATLQVPLTDTFFYDAARHRRSHDRPPLL